MAEALLIHWVIRFGVPLYLITNRGIQFDSKLFNKLSAVVGFHRLQTTSYHIQRNCFSKRRNRTFKAALKARNGKWLQHLPIIKDQFRQKIVFLHSQL